jgi:citrate lyase gamma subunit
MEDITLEKIDTIRKRSGLSYSEAKAALETNDGNVVDTLIYLENNKKSFTNNVSDFGNDILNTVKDIIKKGNVNRIKIKRDSKTLVDIPVNAGLAVGALSMLIPPILALGAVTAIASRITIEIERPDGSVEVVNDIIKSTVEQTIEKAKDIAQDINLKKDSYINVHHNYEDNNNIESTKTNTDESIIKDEFNILNNSEPSDFKEKL